MSNTSENPGDTENETGENKQVDTEQSQNIIVTDNFSINLPAGWAQTQPIKEILVMAVNADENISDPAAQKINFRTYFAIVHEELEGKSMDEYLQNLKDYLSVSIPGTVFTKEEDIIIDDKPTHVMEIELTQNDVNIKALSAIINEQGSSVWVVSFNTTKDNWDRYKETFYGTANSFKLIR